MSASNLSDDQITAILTDEYRRLHDISPHGDDEAKDLEQVKNAVKIMKVLHPKIWPRRKETKRFCAHYKPKLHRLTFSWQKRKGILILPPIVQPCSVSKFWTLKSRLNRFPRSPSKRLYSDSAKKSKLPRSGPSLRISGRRPEIYSCRLPGFFRAPFGGTGKDAYRANTALASGFSLAGKHVCDATCTRSQDDLDAVAIILSRLSRGCLW